MIKQKLIVLLSFLFVLTGCSGSQSDNNDLKFKIISQKADSWVNLMPGSKPSFFISGSLIIESNKNAVLNSVHLLKCEVTQEGKLLYELHPDFQIGDINMDLVNAAGRIFLFNLPPGTPINKKLNMEKPISIDIYLSAINKIYRQRIDSINVLKTY